MFYFFTWKSIVKKVIFYKEDLLFVKQVGVKKSNSVPQ